MAGVNRANVAVTDTFDTWRLRTNEINDTLNQATQAITANTIIFRDDDSSYIANVATLNTISVTHGTTTSAVVVTSALAADGTKASIITTGGIRAEQKSIFAGDVDIEGSISLGNASADNLTITATLSSDLIPTTNAATDIGSTAKHFQNVYNQSTIITGKSTAAAPIFTVLGSTTTNTAANIASTSITTGNVLEVSGTALTTGDVATFTMNSADTSARDVVKITQDHASATGATGLHVKADAGRGVFIDTDLAAGGYSLEIDAEQNVGGAVKIDAATTGGANAKGVEMLFPALTTGKGLAITSASAGISTDGAVVEIDQSNALSSAANVATFSVKTAGNGAYGVKINSSHATSNASLRIDSSTTTKNIVEVVGDSLSSGDGMQINSSAAHTGQLISLSSTNTGDTARGEALFVQYSTANTTAKAVRFANTSADIFSIEQSGDTVVGRDLRIGGNLHVVGTTTEINSTTTLVKDKAVVLGAASNVVTGATYTAANPAVVTSNAHGLDDDDIIFIVTSSGTAIVSEQLVKVTNKTTNTFEAETIAGVDINASSDSTSRTFSWIGPQLDANVDDAGIQIPGSTAVHSILWDDTDNFFKLNDSTKIDSTGQFLFPVGTTAQRPASSASATVPAAVAGAMRFNSTESKFEGVHSGTTFEPMGSESFSIAVAIALG